MGPARTEVGQIFLSGSADVVQGAEKGPRKIFGVDRSNDAIEGVVVDQDRAEHSALRIGRLRHWPIECDIELSYGH